MQKPVANLPKEKSIAADDLQKGDSSMQTEPDAQAVPEVPVDRRRHPRYRFSVPLTIRSEGGEITRAITVEISASGVSAITESSLRLNDTVELEPIAASKISALVRHNVGRVYGFEFLALSSEQSHAIVESCKLLPRYRSKSLGI